MSLFGDRPYTLDHVVRLAMAAFLVWGAVLLLGHLSDVLLPFVVAVLLAYILHPLVTYIQRWTKSRVLAVWMTILASGALVLFVFWMVFPIMIREVAHMGHLLTDLVNNSGMAERAAKRLPPDIWMWLKVQIARPEVHNLFQNDNFFSLAQSLGKRLLPGVWNVITGTANIIFLFAGGVFILMYLVFLLLDFQRVKNSAKELMPITWRKPVMEFLHDFDQAMNRYFRAQAGVAALVGVFFSLGFTLIGLPMGVLLGFFIGLLNMVPYLQTLGLIPAFVLAVIHALETGTSFWVVFGLTVLVFAVAQAIQDMVLVPRIMGKVMGLSSAMILLSLSIWGKLLGFLGLIIALPMTCLLLAYYKRFIDTHSQSTASLEDS